MSEALHEILPEEIPEEPYEEHPDEPYDGLPEEIPEEFPEKLPEKLPEVCNYVTTDMMVALNSSWSYIEDRIDKRWDLSKWNLPKLTVLDRVRLYKTYIADRKWKNDFSSNFGGL